MDMVDLTQVSGSAFAAGFSLQDPDAPFQLCAPGSGSRAGSGGPGVMCMGAALCALLSEGLQLQVQFARRRRTSPSPACLDLQTSCHSAKAGVGPGGRDVARGGGDAVLQVFRRREAGVGNRPPRGVGSSKHQFQYSQNTRAQNSKKQTPCRRATAGPRARRETRTPRLPRLAALALRQQRFSTLELTRDPQDDKKSAPSSAHAAWAAWPLHGHSVDSVDPLATQLQFGG